MIDILEGKNLEIKCLDKGFVRLVDSMPRLCPEGQDASFRIVQSARVSYQDGTKTVNEDRGLIRYLLRHRHSSPLEKIRFEFHFKAPLFIVAQWVRHRTGSFNFLSGRYSVMKEEFYYPEPNNVRIQSDKNKQCSEGNIEAQKAESFLQSLKEDCTYLYEMYDYDLSEGIGREQARIRLPQNLYTEGYWTVDLHNLLHFMALRCDGHAQQEIQVYGNAILSLIKQLVPTVIEAWEDYHELRGGMLLTRLEVEAFREQIRTDQFQTLKIDNKREQSEWSEKALRLGLL